METCKILLWDLDPAAREGCALKRFAPPPDAGFVFDELCGCDSDPARAAGKALARSAPDLVLLACGPNGFASALPLFQAIRAADPRLPMLAAVDDGDCGEISDLLRQGWIDFVTLPLRPPEVFARIMRLVAHPRRQGAFLAGLKEKLGLLRLVGDSPAFQEVIGKIPLMAHCDASVLIAGETGTGKEMCARAIHYMSSRSEHAFVGVNCGAIPGELLENELFGHDREAFTGAVGAKPGLVQEAEGGTLFLDEVDALTPLAQVKLLRLLQEKEYRPLGSTKSRKADVRILAATNVDLETAVREGRIRRDLYYRLNIISLRLPPLRERRNDIPALLDHFLQKFSREYRTEVYGIAPDARRKLVLHAWPGNVRELENAVQRAVLMARGPYLTSADFLIPGPAPEPQGSFQAAKAKLIESFEKEYLQNLLLVHQGNISHAAKAAQKNRRAFWQLLQKHGIEVARFRAKAETSLS